MVRKYLTCFLMLGLLNLQLFAQTKAEKKAAQEAARIAQLKTTITNIGLGDTAPAEVKLKMGGKLIGYVSEMKDGSILFAETALAKTHEVSYAEINSIKAYDPRPKRKVPWANIIIAAVVVATVVIGIKVCNAREKRGETCDPGETY